MFRRPLLAQPRALVAVILRDVQKALARGEDSIVFVEPDVLHGRETRIVSITSPALDGERHRVSQGETLWDIAEDRGQDMYVMRHHNRDVLDPNKVRAGHMVFVPQNVCVAVPGHWSDSTSSDLRLEQRTVRDVHLRESSYQY